VVRFTAGAGSHLSSTSSNAANSATNSAAAAADDDASEDPSPENSSNNNSGEENEEEAALSSTSSSSTTTTTSSSSSTRGNDSTIPTTQKMRPAVVNHKEPTAPPGKFPKTWVPLASTFELNPNRPNPVSFLGQDYVVYYQKHDPQQMDETKESEDGGKSAAAKNATATTDHGGGDDGGGRWVVTGPTCPHRLAPLCEGRINACGNLECSYHGWSFDGTTGLCVRIPQADASVQRAAQSNPLCRIPTYPSLVFKNILFAWVWGDGTDAGTEKEDPEDSGGSGGLVSDASNGTSAAEFFLRNVLDRSTTYTRDVPYNWDTLVENIVDPGHVPWAHHGLQGTRHDAIPINMSLTGPIAPSGFAFRFQDRTMGMRRDGTGVYRAPFVIQYAADYVNATATKSPKRKATNGPNQRTFNLTAICIPTRPGWSRIIIFGSQRDPGKTTADQSNKTTKKQRGSIVSAIFRRVPVWLVHTLSNRFLDSDLAFLHGQDYARQERMRSPGAEADADCGDNDSSSSDSGAGSNRNNNQKSFGYFLPTPSDRSVVAARQWIRDYAHIPGPLPPQTRSGGGSSVLFDRYGQHADHCIHCHTLLHQQLPRYRNRTYWLLAGSLCLLHRFWVARAAAVLSVFALRLYRYIDTVVRHGFFEKLSDARIYQSARRRLFG
jgi:phenylpropionate dioxygenase-like ring-hydroxylating dioxygenase large terminal subunit